MFYFTAAFRPQQLNVVTCHIMTRISKCGNSDVVTYHILRNAGHTGAALRKMQ